MTSNEQAQDGAEQTDSKSRGRRRRRGLKVLAASVATLVVLVGGGLIGVSYYVDSVDVLVPENFHPAQATAIMAADGKTQLAQLGTVNRVDVPMAVLPEKVRNALIAGQDKDFFEDSFRGSELTHLYVRIAVAAEMGSTREMVLARKLEERYDKLSIMGFYLNSADFGRGAVGVETAAQAYFGKSAKDLTLAEAAVLGSVLKQPYDSGGGLSPFDPEAHPAEAKDRWGYVLATMVGQWITAEEKSTLEFPAFRAYATVTPSAEWGLRVKPGEGAGQATGNVVNHVYEELKAQGIEPVALKSGGYRVTTTIDPEAQRLLEQAARPDLKGSELYGRTVVRDTNGKVQQDLESAGVVLDHTTGAVLAYYGGLDARELDQAGVNTADRALIGGHPPGGTMKVYTLAAALEAGASLQSHWKAMPFTTDDKIKVGNSGVPNTTCRDYCTLEYSFVKSFNVPFYWIARQIGPGSVVKMAYLAGVKCMWNVDGKEMISGGRFQDPTDRSPFDRQVGYGKYPITVLDNAAGVATIANGGIYNKPHFVAKVEKKDPATGKYIVVREVGAKLEPQQVMRRAVADDVTYAMTRAAADRNWGAAVGGREIATVGGAWEGTRLDASGQPVPTADNSDAWLVGFTKQITVAVWAGNAAGTYPVIDPKTQRSITAATSFRIWSGVVSGYSGARQLPKEKLPGPAHVGRDDFPLSNGVAP
ncbi:transglycosylase domain-containing protein [Hamadaea sp. NPDC051192]|uniref:transglycosylase domain-containing protein n=1 Tax=Hamadaea sp. NPDC051192 TaxID=3154940 RepID=UPI003428DE15